MAHGDDLTATDAEATAETDRGRGGVDGFDLTGFFPYRLAVLAERVSLAVSQLYADRFDLTRAEWRVIAALGANRTMSARDIGPYSTLDKMQVSRAVARLEERGLLRREDHAGDRRTKILSLTPAGRTLYRRIVPLVRAREDDLLAALEPAERALFERCMRDVQARADGLIARG
ncbi:MarR family winged helix-turn-helix transcriptional regulator [Pinisolibacter sp.]|uniref:MarR family winged helix-turn-helix transcriptional regulator n=1 Tax=Pinisolibacter sp. TaxID=2172024 RepID=UPI002FDE9786